MATCPAGHPSDQTDFCGVCGLPMDAADAAAPEEQPQTTLTCPACQAPNVPEALFCEACGFDFTGAAAPPESPAEAPEKPAWPSLTAPADPDAQAEAPQSSGPQPSAGSQIVSAAQAGAEPTAVPPPASPRPTKPAVEWVAELWIDPDWYASQGSNDPMPSAGLPDIVPLVKEANLIGRLSHSRGIFPDVECELDAGCSRRHAMLTHEGPRWWIEDLGSANGTFVGPAAGPLPAMPIPQGRVELSAGQRIYVGAWTRIVIRKATAEEQQAFAG